MGRRFLIVRLSALGDTVCSLPAAAALKQAEPDCHITWVVDPRFRGIVDLCTSVDEVIAVKPSFSFLRQFKQRFDVSLDLQGLLKSGIVVGRARAKEKVGYHWQREGSRLFSSPVMPDPSSFHVVDQYVDVARSVGGMADQACFNLVPTEIDLLGVRRKLKERGVVGRFVVINAGAGWATKRWPAPYFASLIDKVDSIGLPCVLVGGKADADRQAANEVSEGCQSPPISLLGETSVRELVALVRIASAHVGGDTGSSHIAAAVGTPAIGLYSITRPQRSCPYGQIERCHYDPSGLSNIAPEQVMETLRKVLE